MVHVDAVSCPDTPSTCQLKILNAPPVRLTVEEPEFGAVCLMVVAFETELKPPSPATVSTVNFTASLNPDVEITRASGRSLTSGERWRSITSEPRRAGIPRRRTRATRLGTSGCCMAMDRL